MASILFPGLIDPHVHLRDPGATQKEDFATGSRAAVRGGFTFVCDMPNNPIPTISIGRLEEKIRTSQKQAIIPIGFHYGTDGKNMESFAEAWSNPHVFGLKIYCNHTTGTLLIEDEKIITQIFASWNCDKPILVHAEGEKAALSIALAKTYKRRVHICHISQKSELEMVKKAKQKHMSITCGVTPHHLFLTQKDIVKLHSFGLMKPELTDQPNQSALWEGIHDGTIDVVETDHAPHTKEEKLGEKPPFGVPGLETSLGLLCLAVQKKTIQLDDVKRLLYEKPMSIFHIPTQEQTFIEFDPDRPFQAGEDGYETKCQWSPFDGWELYGKVETVVLGGKTIIYKGKIR
jgi:dihydroorotase